MPEEYFRKNSNKLLTAILDVSRYIQMINLAYLYVIKPENFFQTDEGYYFSFLNLADKVNLYPMYIEQSEGNTIGLLIQSKLEEKGIVPIDLSNTEYIEHTFHTTKIKFMCTLSLAIKRGFVNIVDQKGSCLTLTLSANRAW